MNIEHVLINKINASNWWHVTPNDTEAYKKRGRFLASTYNQAAFYGRPNNQPEKVSIKYPLWAASEESLLKLLFPNTYREKFKMVTGSERNYYKQRIELDAQMHQKAKKLGYDCIVLLGFTGIHDLTRNRKPHSIELNLCV